MNFIKGPPNGHVISGAADDFGWLHNNGLDMWPSSIFPSQNAHNCAFGSDYTLSTRVLPSGDIVQDTIWVTAGDEYGSCVNGWCGLHHWVAASHDGGATFVESSYDSTFTESNAIPYRIATHPYNGSVAIVSSTTGIPVVRTEDGGRTWSNCSGLVSTGVSGNFWWAIPLARENQIAPSGDTPGVFYYYNGTSSVWVSADNGASWNETYSGFPSWDVPLFSIATPPAGTADAGVVWVFSGWKLYVSMDYAQSFSQVWQLSSVQSALTIGPLPDAIDSSTGMHARELQQRCLAQAAKRTQHGSHTSSSPPTAPTGLYSASTSYVVYAIGEVAYGGPTQVAFSVDAGASWNALYDASEGLGDSPNVLDVSLQLPGVVFVGTDGRGAFYTNGTAAIMHALAQCA